MTRTKTVAANLLLLSLLLLSLLLLSLLLAAVAHCSKGSPGAQPTDDAGPSEFPDACLLESCGGPLDAGQLSCATMLRCEQGCGQSAPCRSSCFSAGTPGAQQLASTLDVCLEGPCPTVDGGVCAVETGQCSACQQTASGTTCVAPFDACESGSIDAGASPPDAGPMLSCGQVELCEESCSSPFATACQNNCLSKGSAVAQDLFGQLVGCVDGVCPESDGGTCSAGMDAGGCSACRATATTGPCGLELGNCEADKLPGDGGLDAG